MSDLYHIRRAYLASRVAAPEIKLNWRQKLALWRYCAEVYRLQKYNPDSPRLKELAADAGQLRKVLGEPLRFDLDAILTRHLGEDAVVGGQVLNGRHPLVRDLAEAHQADIQRALRERTNKEPE